jgi:hypothetical protein
MPIRTFRRKFARACRYRTDAADVRRFGPTRCCLCPGGGTPSRRNPGRVQPGLQRLDRAEPVLVRPDRTLSVMPGKLDRGREFAPPLVDGADRSGIGLSDDEHRWSMGRRVLVGQPSSTIRRTRRLLAPRCRASFRGDATLPGLRTKCTASRSHVV